MFEMLLNVLLWIAYDPGRGFFGVYTWIGIVLVLLIGVPAIFVYHINPGTIALVSCVQDSPLKI